MSKETKTSKRIRVAVLSCAVAAVIGVGGAAAYFTDTQEAVNTFTVGKIDIQLDEPKWEEWNESDPDPIVPDQEIPKDPTIKNIGDNDAYLFATVKVPTAEIITAAESGARNAKAETQLFGYTVNTGWTLLTSEVKNAGSITVSNKTGAYGIREFDNTSKTGYVTYVYAYTGSSAASMQKVPAGTSAPSLFNAVKFVNAIEGQGLENSDPSITVKGYGIQADFLNDKDEVTDGTNEGGTTSPSAVWKILETQNNI